MATHTDPAEQAVTAAEAHLAAIEQAAADLADQVRTGAEVDPAELGHAGDLVALARLRVEAAQRQLDNARTAARHATYREVADNARQVVTADTTVVVRAHAAAVTALRDLVAAAADRERHLRDAMREVRSAVAAATTHHEAGALADLGVPTDLYGQGTQMLRYARNGTRVDVHPVPAPLLALDALAVVWDEAAAAYAAEHGQGHAHNQLPRDVGQLRRLTDRVRRQYPATQGG